MMTIQKKIMYITLFVVFMMITVWAFMNYNSQKTRDQYEDILQRYMLLNEISNSSARLNSTVNQFRLEKNDVNHQRYVLERLELLELKVSLAHLANDYNRTELINYHYLIDGFVDTLDFAMNSIRENRHELADQAIEEAFDISNYISETTLTLIGIDLDTYDEFMRGIISQSQNVKKMELWVLSLATCLMILLSLHLSENITRPIRMLSQAAREFSYGKLDRDIAIDTHDEIGFLSKTFNRMRKDLQKFIVEIQQKAKVEQELQNHKLLLKESELKSLQSQINPHFLFNTLNTLSKKAYLEGAEETSDLISSTSAMMRYHLRRLDDLVTLEAELSNLENYLLIQKARFGERIHYEVDVEKSCLSFEMPNLVLQPFVENAFIHGVEPLEEGGKIEVFVRDVNDRIHITISDNGPGISPERKEAIIAGQSLQKNSQSTGIGIYNVISRLRLHYDTWHVIEIESDGKKGTSIHLLLPKKRGSRIDPNLDRR